MSDAPANHFGSIASAWGALFPARPAQIDFLEATLAPGLPDRWMDVACGSGQHLEALVDRGHDVYGIDAAADMVQALGARRPDLAARVAQADMRDLPAGHPHVEPATCGVVYCIGNSLVQFLADADIRRTLEGCHALLVPQGVLVVQIVNFDRVLDGDFAFPVLERSLPDGTPVRLTRRYTPATVPGCITFHSRFEAPGRPAEERAHDIRALRRHELEGLLAGCGFRDVRSYADYDAAPWHPDGAATIVRARRG